MTTDSFQQVPTVSAQDSYGRSLAFTMAQQIVDYYRFTLPSDLDELTNICAYTIMATLNGQRFLTLSELSSMLNLSDSSLKQIVKRQAKFFSMKATNHSKSEQENISLDLNPIVFKENKFYLYRYWKAEQNVIQKIEKMNAYRTTREQETDLTLRGDVKNFSKEQVKVAELVSDSKQGITIVTGSAGTGKSWTMIKIVEEIFKKKPDCLISMCAPTGKAVSRLSNDLGEDISITVQTIHRLLQIGAYNNQARYHAQNFLAYEYVIVDEVSMLDIELFCQLVQALRTDCKLILMGDSAQLLPIGVGGVLSLVQHHFPHHCINLEQQHRSEENSPIIDLANMAREGSLLRQKLPEPHHLHASVPQQETLLREWIEQYLFPCYRSKQYDELLQQMIVSPWRYSHNGVIQLNQFIQKILFAEDFIAHPKDLCEGLIIVIRENNLALQIYNGDRGYLISENNELYAIINHQKIATKNLPNYDLSYAMTVHQMQGSEVDNLFLWLGTVDDKAHQWLNDNLLYTAVTRAKKNIQICADIQVYDLTDNHS